MISRENFLFCIGYDGEVAIVDAKAKKTYGLYSTAQLLEIGLYKAALSSAVYANNQDEINLVMETYNKNAKTSYKTLDTFKKLLGINKEEVNKVKLL